MNEAAERSDGLRTMPDAISPLEVYRVGEDLHLIVSGPWTIRQARDLDTRLRAIDPAGASCIEIDLAGLTALDTVGGWLIRRTAEAFEQAGATVSMLEPPVRFKPLLGEIERSHPPRDLELNRPNKILELLELVGSSTVVVGKEARLLLSFFGMLVVKLGRMALQPYRLKPAALATHIEQTGLHAVPIVCLLSFLIGVVLAYQGAAPLRQFGAEILVVNLLGISILRELGILITAIIIAGRSGSAFTAQIGTMKVNQEIDAMETIGLDPVDRLVLPRVIALAITLPLLGFLASIVGLAGGAIMSWVALDIDLPTFMHQLRTAVPITHVWAGLVKAPVFAFIIAMVGCYEGLKVSGSAESVGRQTTRAVVASIFLVILVDALFSIFFSILGI